MLTWGGVISICLEKILYLTVGLSLDHGIGDNTFAVKIIRMCLLC